MHGFICTYIMDLHGCIIIYPSLLELGRYKNIGQKVRQETGVVWAVEIPSTSWMAIHAG
jgi:hypothetical protein